MKVPLADLIAQYHAIRDELNDAIAAVLCSGQFILGPRVEALETEVAACCGAGFGVAVNSGTDALLLALLAHGISPGDEVVTSPFTFVASVEAISVIGATPVFADIEPGTFNLCPSAAAQSVTPRTRALMPIDLFGQMANRSALGKLAADHQLTVIWDSAQAIGARYADKPLGAFPGSATLSFFPTKNLGAYGDGGMVLTDDPAVRDALRSYRFHGSGGGYEYARIGYCSRLDAIQAAVLSVKLRHLAEWTAARRKHADTYRNRLADTRCVLPALEPFAQHTYHQFTIRHPERDRLRRFLSDAGVESGIYYPKALHLQHAYEHLGYREGQFPEAERATREVLSLPIHQDLSDEQVEYACDRVLAFEARA